MIKVKFFGVLRLDYNVKYLELEPVKNVSELIKTVAGQTEIPAEKLKGCSFVVNNALSSSHTSLKDGDEVLIMTPVAGG